jgi:hypothetical protein
MMRERETAEDAVSEGEDATERKLVISTRYLKQAAEARATHRGTLKQIPLACRGMQNAMERERTALLSHTAASGRVWLDRATIQFRFFGPSSFNTALQLVLRPHFLVHFV